MLLVTAFKMNVFPARLSSSQVFFSCLVFLMTVACAHFCFAQDVPTSDQLFKSPISENTTDAEWRLEIAKQALEEGLPSIAERIFREILSDQKSKALSSYPEYLLEWTESLIAIDNIDEAQTVLTSFEDKESSSYLLMEALASASKYKYAEAESLLNKFSPESLPPKLMGWYYFLIGIIAEVEHRPTAAENAFASAKKAAVSKSQLAEFELGVLRNRLKRDPMDNDTFIELEQNVRAITEDTKLANSYRLQYATALYLRGQKDTAISFLLQSLQNIPETDPSWSIWMLQLAHFNGLETEKGKALLRSLIFKSNQSEIRLSALFLFIKNADKPEIISLTEELLAKIGNDTQHLELLYSLLYFYAQTGEFEFKNQDIRSIIDSPENPFDKRFPNSNLKTNTYWLLAYISYKKTPPEYRTAANYLLKFIAQTTDGNDRELAKNMIADCYYRNGDFEMAARFCREAFAESKEVKTRGRLFLQESVSLLKLGQADALIKRMQEINATDPTVIPQQVRWQVEWDLLDFWRKAGQPELALKRMLLIRNDLESADSITKVRFLWLATILCINDNDYDNALKAVQSLQNEINKHLIDRSDPENLDIDLLSANALLLHSEILFVLSRKDTSGDDTLANQALSLSKELRTKYPNFDASVFSLFIESRYYAGINRLVDAQQRLIELADSYPKSRLAPIALYEAAVNSSQRKLTETSREALRLIDRLAKNYPNSDILYRALLLQGDIQRTLNEFGDAEQTYDNLITKYPNNPLRHLAELYRADCIYASASKNQVRYDNAAAAYERLYDQSTLPPAFRIEAGYKWANSLIQGNKPNRAQEVLWTIIQTFLDQNKNADQLDSLGRNWLARCILDLGKQLDQAKKTEESRIVYDKILQYKLPGSEEIKKRIKPE